MLRYNPKSDDPKLAELFWHAPFTNRLDEFCRIVRNGAISSGTFKTTF